MSLPQMSFYGGVMISAVLLLRALLGRKLPETFCGGETVRQDCNAVDLGRPASGYFM